MQWTAIVNPTAGRGRTRKLLPRLREAFDALGIDVYVSRDVADGRRVARDAFDEGQGVVACGGDGTVSELAAVASECDGTVAIVPTGAGNDFARQLGIDTHDPIEAASLVATGHSLVVDLGRATTADGSTRIFTTVANTGFDAEANRWANGVHWATGTPLYLLAVVRTLFTYRPQPVTVRVDDSVWEDDAWLVAVGNSRFYAGGMKITPTADITDGTLDVCILGPGSVGELVWNFPRVFRGTHVELEKVTMLRGAHVEVASPDARIPMELWASGEQIGALPGAIDVVPRAVRVQVPRTT